jgi:hypothetical protein
MVDVRHVHVLSLNSVKKNPSALLLVVGHAPGQLRSASRLFGQANMT